MLVHKLCLSTSYACTASLNLIEKPGRTLVRFDRFFQEPTAQACSIANKVCAPCALAHSRLVFEQAQLPVHGFLGVCLPSRDYVSYHDSIVFNPL
jgi:hypothetical protein